MCRVLLAYKCKYEISCFACFYFGLIKAMIPLKYCISSSSSSACFQDGDEFRRVNFKCCNRVGANGNTLHCRLPNGNNKLRDFTIQKNI